MTAAPSVDLDAPLPAELAGRHQGWLTRYRRYPVYSRPWVRGRLRTLVNGLETANDAKAYEVGFAYSGGRMHLKTFKEVTHAAP